MNQGKSSEGGITMATPTARPSQAERRSYLVRCRGGESTVSRLSGTWRKVREAATCTKEKMQFYEQTSSLSGAKEKLHRASGFEAGIPDGMLEFFHYCLPS
jgi:hypothetical protein